MNYHNILHDNLINGSGIRVVLFVSGCNHKCKNCQNPQTWDINSGIKFDKNAKNEIFEELSKEYVDGLTLSGGDPLHPTNRKEIIKLIKDIRKQFGNTKTIWLYTGYLWNQIKDIKGINLIDVLIDGEFYESKKTPELPWIGSSNQKIIDVKKTINQNKIILYKEES